MINDRVVQKLKALNERYGAMLDDEAFEALDHAIEALQGCEVGRCPTCSRWLETRCPVCGPVEPKAPQWSTNPTIKEGDRVTLAGLPHPRLNGEYEMRNGELVRLPENREVPR